MIIQVYIIFFYDYLKKWFFPDDTILTFYISQKANKQTSIQDKLQTSVMIQRQVLYTKMFIFIQFLLFAR